MEKLFFKNNNILGQFLISFLFAGITAFISILLNFLSKSGAIAAFILAFLIYGFGGLKWAAPILVFFFLSSFLSKLRSKNNPSVETYFGKSSKRDYVQVLSNGGIGGLLVVMNYFYPSELFYVIYVSFLASVCADTWSTEFGTIFKTKTYNILNFKKIQQGQSGGVSFNGIAGAISGALIIAISSLEWVIYNKLAYVVFVAIAGLSGSLLDSIMGASIQAQYKCPVCSKETDKKNHCKSRGFLKRGFYWINNDVVNFSSGLAGSIIGVILIDLYG